MTNETIKRKPPQIPQSVSSLELLRRLQIQGKGRIYIHGDALILESPQKGEAEATNATNFVSGTVGVFFR